jgi:hypothetical protein
LEEEGQWEDHKIDGKMPYRGTQPTPSGFETGRLHQEMSGGRRLGGHGLKTGQSAIEEEEVLRKLKICLLKCDAIIYKHTLSALTRCI